MTRHVVARVEDIAPGSSRIVDVAGREVGVFNVAGDFYALANRCPHAGASLCQGFITGIVRSEGPNDYRIERKGEFIRCPFHGWEFDIRTGQSWCDPNSLRVRQFNVAVAPGETLVKGPYVAESFPVRVEEDYLVIDV